MGLDEHRLSLRSRYVSSTSSSPLQIFADILQIKRSRDSGEAGEGNEQKKLKTAHKSSDDLKQGTKRPRSSEGEEEREPKKAKTARESSKGLKPGSKHSRSREDDSDEAPRKKAKTAAEVHGERPVGLHNSSRECYINTTVQCLKATPGLETLLKAAAQNAIGLDHIADVGRRSKRRLRTQDDPFAGVDSGDV